MLVPLKFDSGSRGRLLTTLLLGTGLAAASSLPREALAGPHGEKVVHGKVAVTRSDDLTVIKASNNSIINFKNFDIAANETVQFIQPNSLSRVFARVSSKDATHIDGMLLANGRLYIVNPSGIYFGNHAIVSAAGIYAAAGTIGDADFLHHQDHFTNLTGSVVNAGQITSPSVGLIGASVINSGSIVADHGFVAFAAGDEVFFAEPGRQVMVKANPTAAPTGSQTSVQNTGSITASQGSVSLVAGDIYGATMLNSGNITARNVTLDGGRSGSVKVSGKIDASDTASGQTGGSVAVLGKDIKLQGATIDASGSAGGGVILVGGDTHGGGGVPTAATTWVDAGSLLKADAFTTGDGGKIVVWSDVATIFTGSLSAQGSAAGGGGFAEVSSRGQLTFQPVSINLGGGNLLLDPDTIVIQDILPDINGDGTPGDDITSATDLNNATTTPTGGVPTPATADSVITSANLNTILATTDVTLAAVTSITDNAVVTPVSVANGVTLTFDAPTVNLNRSITLAGTGTLSGGAAVATVNVGTGGKIQQGILVAPSGTTVNIASGAYAEAVVINKPLTVAVPAGTVTASSWTSNAGSPVTLSGNYSTAGAFIFNDAVTLGGTTNLTGATATFLDTVAGGAHGLTVTGNAVFGDAAGDTVTGLTTLHVTGTSGINTNTVTTSSTQAYDGAVTLGTTTNLTATGSTVTFLGTVAGGAHGLTVTGNAVFGNAVGDTVTGLTTLHVTGTSAINTNTVTTTLTQAYDDDVTAVNNANLSGTTLTFLGDLSPNGASKGTLTVTGDLAMGAASTLTIQVDGKTTAGTDFDRVAVSGGVTLAAGTTLHGTSGGASLMVNDQVQIITSGSAVAGAFTNSPAALSSRSFGITYPASGPNGVVLTLQPTARTWDGGGADDNWMTAANWASDIRPDAGDALVFGGATRTTNNNNFAADTLFRSITFSAAGGVFTLNGNAIQLSAGVTNNSAQNNTISLNITTTAAQTFTSGVAAKTLAFGGTTTLGGDLIVTGPGNIQMATLNGPHTLTKSGAGTLTLTANNGYTGLTTISGGTLIAASDGALGTAAAGTTVSGGATLGFQGGINYSTAEAVTINGTGDAGNSRAGAIDNIAGANTFAGAVTLASNSTVGATAGSLTLGGTVTKDGVDLTFKNGTFIVDGQITGASAHSDLIVDGATVTLDANNNNYNGNTSVFNGGTLINGIEDALPSGTTLTLGDAGNTGGTYDLNGHDQTIAGLSGAGTGTRIVTNEGGVAAILTISSASGSTTFGGVIQDGTGAVGLTKGGASTFTLSGANTYTGLTTVSGGTLVAAGNNALGTAAAGTTVGAGATLAFPGGVTYSTAEPVTINGVGVGAVGAINNIIGINSFAGPVTLGSASTIGSTAGSLILTGGISGSGQNLTLAGEGGGTISGAIATTSGSLTKSGGGTWILTAANTYGGATAVSAGILQIGNGPTGSIDNTSAVTVAGKLSFDRSNSFTFSPSISGGGTLDLAGTGNAGFGGAITIGMLTIAPGAYDVSLTNPMTVTNAVTFNNTGVLTLDSGNKNFVGGFSHTGTTHASGKIQAGSSTTLTPGTLILDGDTTFATVNLALGAVTGGGHDLTIQSSGTTTLSGAIAGVDAFAKSGSNPMLMGLNSSLSANTVSIAGNLEAQASTSIHDARTISLTGATTVDDGKTFTLQTTGGAGTINVSSVALGSNSILEINASGAFTANSFIQPGVPSNAATTLKLTHATSAIFNGNLTVANLNVTSGVAGPVAFNGNLGVANLTIDDAFTGPIAFNANVSVTSATAFTFKTPGTVVFGDDSGDQLTFAGGVTHLAGPTTVGGKLSAGGNGAIMLGATVAGPGSPSITSTTGDITLGALTLANGSHLTLATAAPGKIHAASILGPATGSADLAVTSSGSGDTFSVSGQFGTGTHLDSLTLNGGQLTISPANSYSVGSTVVNSGATLATSGSDTTITGNVTVNANGVLAPGGASPVTLDIFGNLNMAQGSILSVQVNGGATPTNDQVKVHGTATLTGGPTLTVVPSGVIGTGDIAVLSSTRATSGTFTPNSFTLSGNTFNVVSSPGGIVLSVPITAKIWDGLGEDDNWSTAMNWTDKQKPVAGDVLMFAGTVRPNPIDDLADGTAFASITFNAGSGAFTLGGNSIKLLGGVTNSSINLQTINIPITLTGGRTFNSGAGGLKFGGALKLGGDLTLKGPGNIEFAAFDGMNHNVTVSSEMTSGTTIFARNVTNLGSGNGAALTVATGVTGQVRFEGTVTAKSGIVAANTSDVRFDDNVTLIDGDTGTSLLGKVTFGELTFSGFDGITLGATTLSGVLTTLNSNGGRVEFKSTVDSATPDGSGSLTITGNALFDGAVGGQTNGKLGTLSVSGTTGLAGNVTTTGAQTYGNAVALSPTGGAVIVTSSGNAAVSFAGPVTGTQSLTVNTTGATTFGSTVDVASLITNAGGTTSLAGNVTTSGAQTYGDAVTLTGGAMTAASSGDKAVSFNGAVTGAQTALTVNTAGATTFGSTVDVASLITNAGGTTSLAGNVTTTASIQEYNDDVTTLGNITLTGSTVTFNADLSPGGGNVVELNITGGLVMGKLSTLTVQVNNDVLPGVDFDQVVVSGGTVTLTPGASLKGTSDPSATLTVNKPIQIIESAQPPGSPESNVFALNTVTLSSRTFMITYPASTPTGVFLTLQSQIRTWTGGGADDFWTTNSNWDTGKPDTGDPLVFAGTLRLTPDNNFPDGTAFASIAFKAGSNAFILGGNGINLSGGVTNNSTSLQTINIPITLPGGQTSLVSGIASTSALTFGKAINGAQTLTLSGPAPIRFQASLGANTALTSIISSAPTIFGDTVLHSPVSVTTSGSQTYSNAVTLDANTVLVSTPGTPSNVGGIISFGSTVNGAFGLTVNTTGATTFGGTIGNSVALTSLTTDAGGTTSLAGNVTTSGAQTYGDPVTLTGSAVTATALNMAAVSFNGAVMGTQTSLTVNTMGATTFGSTVEVASLTTDLGGTTNLAGNVTTSGAQTYGDAVTLTGGAVTATSSITGDMAAVSFNGPVAGAQSSLTVNTAGATTFGSSVSVKSLTTDKDGTTSLAGSVTTSGAQNYGDAVTLTGPVALNSNGGAIEIASLDGGSQNLTLAAGNGAIAFDGDVNRAGDIIVMSASSISAAKINANSLIIGKTELISGTATFTGAITTPGGEVSIVANGDVEVKQGIKTKAAIGGSVELNSATGNIIVGTIDTSGVGVGGKGGNITLQASSEFVTTMSDSTKNSTARPYNRPKGFIQLQGNLIAEGGKGTASGDAVGVGGSISLNAVDRVIPPATEKIDAVPAVATIYRDNTGAGGEGKHDLIISGGSVKMGAQEKLTVTDGSLTINAASNTTAATTSQEAATVNATGNITLGDISVLKDFKVNFSSFGPSAPGTQIITFIRAKGHLLVVEKDPSPPNNLVATLSQKEDEGVDVVAGGVISSNIITDSINSKGLHLALSSFASNDPGTLLRGVKNYPDELSYDVLFHGEAPFDLRALGKPNTQGLLHVFVDPTPRELPKVVAEAGLSAAQKDELQEMFIVARDPSLTELLSLLSGSGFFNDVPAMPREVAGGTDFTIVVNRMSPEQVNEVLDEFREIFMTHPKAEDTKTANSKNEDPSKQWVFDTDGKVAAIQASLKTPLDDFVAANPDGFDPVAFRAFLNANPDKYPAALANLKRLRGFFAKVETLGLTSLEAKNVRRGLLRTVNPDPNTIKVDQLDSMVATEGTEKISKVEN